MEKIQDRSTDEEIVVSGRNVDITGKRFGKWLIIERVDASHFKAQCDCGVTKIKRRCDFFALRNAQCTRCRLKSLDGSNFRNVASMYRNNNNE